jgi:hypothetical protein
MLDILLVTGFVFLGTSGFIFIQLAVIVSLLNKNESLHTELEQRNKAYWEMLDRVNSVLK